MKLREILKRNMPLPLFLHYINKKRLKNKDFTLLTPNCLAGIIYHNLGLQFSSPTINLQFNDKTEFYKFCNNLEYYTTLKLTEIKKNHLPPPYPLAKLGDLTLHLVHYKTFKEGFEKWEIRKRRINFNNIFIITDDYCNENSRLSEQDIKAFSELKYAKNIIIFTQDKINIPNTKYIGEKRLKNFMKTNTFTGIRVFELYFDYVHFLNNKKSDK